MSASHPAFQRLSRVYVQVPPSPHTMSGRRPVNPTLYPVSSTKLKENAPLRTVDTPTSGEQATSASATLKRKASEREPSSLVLDGVVIISKKAKLPSGALKPTQPHVNNSTNDASEDEIKFTYCHQCSQKRDRDDTIQCTVVDRFMNPKDKYIRERACVNKYCRSCLKNRYGLDLSALKSTTCRDFMCPRCRDVCNCHKCRKSKGLEPVGVMAKNKKNITETEATKKSAGSKPTAVAPSKPNPPKKATVPPKKVAVKPLPLVRWTKVPTNLSYDEITQRIFIREFFLRFGDIMDPPLAKMHLDELELIAGRGESDEGRHGWVSEVCLRASVISLLGLLMQNYEYNISKYFKTTFNDIRAAGANLTKVWSALSSLQKEFEAHPETFITEGNSNKFTFQLDSPAGLSPDIRRSLRQPDDGIDVAFTSQMIPVILSMINHALATRIIREDLDQAGKDVREWQPAVRDATKRETERWEKERESITSAKSKAQQEENKAKRKLHKEQLENIENCKRIITPSYLSRFTSLGFDDDQREYFALSPCASEREAAHEYLDVAASERPMKCKKKGRVLSLEDRRELRDWSWFIGVYGTKPPGALDTRTPSASSAGPDGDASNDGPQWWGFWDQNEIDKVAEWISLKSGLEDEDASASATTTSQKAILSPREAQLKRLIAGLKEYSRLLGWRSNPEKCHLVKGAFSNPSQL